MYRKSSDFHDRHAAKPAAPPPNRGARAGCVHKYALTSLNPWNLCINIHSICFLFSQSCSRHAIFANSHELEVFGIAVDPSSIHLVIARNPINHPSTTHQILIGHPSSTLRASPTRSSHPIPPFPLQRSTLILFFRQVNQPFFRPFY